MSMVRSIKRQCTPVTVRANTGQSINSVSMLGQRRMWLTSIEPAMDCDAGPTLAQHWAVRPTLCVPGTSYISYTIVVEGIGLHVEDILVSFPVNDSLFDHCWASFVDVGTTLVQHWVDVSCLLGWFCQYIIISWTFLAHEKTNTAMFTKYWDIFLSKALKQTKAGPRSSGNPFLVLFSYNFLMKHKF